MYIKSQSKASRDIMASSKGYIDLAIPICNLVLPFQTKKVRRAGNIIFLILFFILEIKIMGRAITIKTIAMLVAKQRVGCPFDLSSDYRIR